MTTNLPPEPDPTPNGGAIARADYLADRLEPALAPEESAQPTSSNALVAYLHAFRRRWFLALSLGILGAAVTGAIVWTMRKPMHTAAVQFRVAAVPESLVFEDPRASAREDFEIYKNTQLLHVKSAYVLNAALRDKEVKIAELRTLREEEDPVRWLMDNIKVGFPGNGEIMNLSLTANDPDEVALIMAAVAKAYLKEVVNQEHNRQSSRLNEMKAMATTQNGLAAKKRGELRDLAKSLGTNSSQALSNQQKQALDQWNSVRKELYTIQIEVTRLRAECDLKKDQLQRATAGEAADQPSPALFTEFDLEARKASDVIYNELTRQVMALHQQAGDVNALGSPVQKAKVEQEHQAKLKSIDKQMSAREEELKQELRRGGLVYLKSEVSDLEAELAKQITLEKQFAADEAKYRREVKDFGGSSQAAEDLERELSRLEGILAPIDQQVRELEVELQRPSRVTRVTRVEGDTLDAMISDYALKLEDLARAIRPTSPDSNKRTLNAAVSGVAAFFVIVGGILFWDVQAKRVNSSLDVSHSLGLSVIGAIPLVPTKAVNRNGSSSAKYRRWRALLNESMRGVMVRLLHEAGSGKSQIVMVSSASANEGKSTLATNLALAMARAGYRTLLVDCDLRRPSLGGLFDLPTAPGVSEVLRREVSLDDSIHQIYTDDLFVLTAGEWSPYQVSVLANGETEGLFESLRKRFQFIVVDGSPILGVAEAQLLCRHADTVLLSVLRDVSSTRRIVAACDTLAAFGVQSLYAVVTGTGNSDYEHYYGGYGYEREGSETT